jgi:Ran GTPase-activating protein (RanGAP) involved in mRNA processing and transport
MSISAAVQNLRVIRTDVLRMLAQLEAYDAVRAVELSEETYSKEAMKEAILDNVNRMDVSLLHRTNTIDKVCIGLEIWRGLMDEIERRTVTRLDKRLLWS